MYVRMAIEQTEIEPKLVESVLERMGKFRNSEAIFRSSTNSEDLKDFNGAGLYDSVIVRSAKAEEVGKAIKRVWASAWGARAFLEREFFNIDGRNVGVAILVQPLLSDGTGHGSMIGNGVAVGRHPFADKPGCIHVNVTPGSKSKATEASVAIVEQIIIHTARVVGEVDLELLTPMATSEGQLLARQDAVELAAAFNTLAPLVIGVPFLDLKAKSAPSGTDTAKVVLDVEFAILAEPKRHVVILQARPLSYAVSASSPLH